MDPRIEKIQIAAGCVQDWLKGRRPVAGIVLGSGLGKLADVIEDQLVIPYRDIPGFPVSTAVGHKGNFIVGTLGGKTVIAMQGRIHYYEGYGMENVVLPIRVMIGLGIKYLFVSNAAGGVSFKLHVGDLMIIRDHINLLPNPLIGAPSGPMQWACPPSRRSSWPAMPAFPSSACPSLLTRRMTTMRKITRTTEKTW